MEVGELLLRLEGVRGRNGSWSAKCPAHDDRTPSLSVKETSDGRILMHCFGGCGAVDVLASLGLKLTDLFLEPLSHFMPRRRGDFTPADALRGLTFESSIVAIAAADIAEGIPVDVSRVCVAAGRIAEALEFIHGE